VAAFLFIVGVAKYAHSQESTNDLKENKTWMSK
jgi:hypothetical protein